MGIIKGIACHERNRAARRAIRKAVKSKGLFGKIVRGAIIYTIVSTLATSVLPQAISVAATFKQEGPHTKEEFVEYTKDWVQNKVDDFTGTFSEIVDDAKFANEKTIKEMAQDFGKRAEIFANENGTTFLKASIARVVDGDTIVVDIYGDNCGDKSHECTVRLIGVNTPESVASEEYLAYKGTENCEEGVAASDFVKEYLSDKTYVYLESDKGDTDKYGRLLRYVWTEIPENEYDVDVVATEMLNGVLLEEGYAEVATYKPNEKYVDYFTAIEQDSTDDFAIDR